MRYLECDLMDRGYVDVQGALLQSIDGLTNVGDESFRHLGYSGYPANALAQWERPDKSRCVAVFADGEELPEGGTEIAAADMVALLVADYGWPAGSRLVDGMPMGPDRAL